jgi:hypothetical protein
MGRENGKWTVRERGAVRKWVTESDLERNTEGKGEVGR